MNKLTKQAQIVMKRLDNLNLHVLASVVKQLVAKIENPDQWINVDITQPQVDFTVIGCCDDDVEQCIFRDGDDGYWFELPGGEIFEATHWMPFPQPTK